MPDPTAARPESLLPPPRSGFLLFFNPVILAPAV
jgi:hypothetical protein